MKKLSKFALLFAALPFVSYAQCGLECDPTASAILLGGENYARECYLNSRMVAQNSDLVSYGMLEPCDFALTHVELTKENLAATHTNRGVIRVALGNFDDAFSDFNIAMNLLPEAAPILLNRGNAYYHSGNYQRAIEDYMQSMELGFSEFSDVYVNLGKSYERMGNVSQAEQNYRRAIELAPEQMEAQRLLQGLTSQ
jgi:tetratricopeptide (TPR) repeat protein